MQRLQRQLNYKNSLDCQIKNHKIIGTNNNLTNSYSNAPISNKSNNYYIGETKLRINPVVHPDESNEINRIDRLMKYVNNFSSS